MPQLKRLVDNTNSHSYAARARQERFRFFHSLQASLPRPYHILDVGGTQRFWEVAGFVDEPGVSITIYNLKPPQIDRPGFHARWGDACDMVAFADGQFDVIFSNSVIEHVGTFDQQRRMADEVRRVGRRYFVQTPNYYFPLEPHFLVPGFQWLPVETRAWLLHHFNLGWFKRRATIEEARHEVGTIRLLRRKELVALFPEAELYYEKALGLVKSFVVYAGW